jgi:hypothetical protein
MRGWPAYLLAAGAVLLAGVLVAVLLVGRGGHEAVPTTTSAPPPTTTVAPPPPPTTTTAPAPPPPKAVPFAWTSAGGLIVNASEVDPTLLGQRMRADGFGWVAVLVADGTAVRPSVQQWASLFAAASGLPVGGWSVLRDHPVEEARLAASLLGQYGLSFYVANAEREYEYTNGADRNGGRYRRSATFVRAFRAAEPTMPAALSSYCDASLHDIDWGAWANAGFDFLPQAYTGTLGASGTPAACTAGALKWFPRARVHPTVALFGGQFGTPSPAEYGSLLQQAGTTGFSLYPAETAQDLWEQYGAVIRAGGVAAAPAG